MIKETFAEYVDRVSRARHVLMAGYSTQYDYFRGIVQGYSFAKELGLRSLAATVAVEELSGFARRLSLHGKTMALVNQDRVLTYRESEVK